MSIQELEVQLLKLDRADRLHMLQVLEQSLQSNPTSETPTPPLRNLADFFRNSPLCEVADELDLTRDRSPIPDRIAL